MYIQWNIQFSSVTQSCPTFCDPMNRSMPGLPVHHHLPDFTQTHIHRIGDAIQPSHPLSSLSPPAPNPSQHQSLFQWVNSSHEVAKVLVVKKTRENAREARDVGLIWVGKISWRRTWQPIPIFMLEKFHGQEPGRLLSMGSQKSQTQWSTHIHQWLNANILNTY